MSRIPFILARFPSDLPKIRDIEARLQTALEKIREHRFDRASADDLRKLGDGVGTEGGADIAFDPCISTSDTTTIHRRAGKYLERLKAQSALSALKGEDLRRLEVLKDGIRVVQIATDHQADEIAATLHTDMPWMAEATTAVWHALRRCASRGSPAKISPLVLDGPPAIGKTFWAKRLGGLIGVPTEVLDAGNENAGFGIGGTQKGWGTQGTGRLLDSMLRDQVGNPIWFVDEIDKAGAPQGTTGNTYLLENVLLALLEPTTNSEWQCPYFRVKFDMSHVSWILASNDLKMLRDPLKSRCQVISVPEPTIAQLSTFAEQQGRKRHLSDASISAITAALASHRNAQSRRPDMRITLRMLDRAEVLEGKPVLN